MATRCAHVEALFHALSQWDRRAAAPVVNQELRTDPGPEAVRKWLPTGLSIAAALGWSLFVAVHGNQVDIDVYRFGGRHVFHPDLYTARLGTLYFTYTPFAALAFALPSLTLSTLTFQVLWALANMVALAGLIYLSIRVTVPQLGRRRAVQWALLLLTPALLLDPVFIRHRAGSDQPGADPDDHVGPGGKPQGRIPQPARGRGDRDRSRDQAHSFDLRPLPASHSPVSSCVQRRC